MTKTSKAHRTQADIVIAGGGTGGHVYPAIAIGSALRRLAPELDIVFMGNPGRMEARVVPEHGFDFEPISSAGFPRKLSLSWFRVFGKVPAGVWQSLHRLRQWQPRVVVGTGGYVCGPVLFAASLLGIPILIQEQNAVPGITNKWVSRWATEIHIAFDAARQHFHHTSIHHTGNPLRTAVTKIAGRRLPPSSFGLEDGRLTITVMGGSQGATRINHAVLAALGSLDEAGIQWIHQTGSADEALVQQAYREHRYPHRVQAFFPNMHEVFAITDLMICRAGGMTLSEITSCALPAILIPYPYATGDHQQLNAEAIVKAGAARLILERELTGEALTSMVTELIQSPDELKRMAEASGKLGRPDAAESIAQAVLNLAGGDLP